MVVGTHIELSNFMLRALKAVKMSLKHFWLDSKDVYTKNFKSFRALAGDTNDLRI